LNAELEKATLHTRPDKSPSFGEAVRFWIKLGFISFGGPSGQIAIMHTELVERRRWIDNAHFLHALNFCMVLPGPEAQQLAIYIGWVLHRIRGGVVAGALFVLPSVGILWTLSFIYVRYGNLPWIAAMFYGLKPAVLAIVVAAVVRIGQKALKTAPLWLVAGVAFIAIFFFRVPFPTIVFGGALVGLLGKRLLPGYFSPQRDAEEAQAPAKPARTDSVRPRHYLGSIKVVVIIAVIWACPLVLAGLWLGPQHTVFREAIFFSKAAVVTFGGAYAVLPYVSQQAVESYHWLAPGQMLDGLGLAETTPGPLIMVLQFVGFVGGWNHPGNLSPLLAATCGALVTTWTTFVPCFLWVFLGAPYLEQLRGNTLLSAALTTVTAAVVGVILNLAVWFGTQVLFPQPYSIDWFALSLCLAAFVAMMRYKVDIIPVVLASALAGLGFKLALAFVCRGSC
jgi:chromate transporter